MMLNPFNRIFGKGDKLSAEAEDEQEEAYSLDEVIHIPIDQITPNQFQPRTVFNEDKIKELAQTIHTHGMIQPIVVRTSTEDTYEIIAGERRWRASQVLEWEKIPAIIRNMTDTETASVALIENLQREELTVIEEAKAYEQLLEMHDLTQEALAQRLGKSQSTIANKLRLLKLSDVVQAELLNKTITERHARALMKVTDVEVQTEILQMILESDLNVRQTEEYIEKLFAPTEKKEKKTVLKGFNKDIRIAVNTIRQSLHMVSETGINVETDEEEHDDYYQITIKLPKRK